MPPTRRTMLWLLATGVPSLAIGAQIYRARRRGSPRDLLLAFCADSGGDARTRAVGEDFLRQFPDENSIERLAAELTTALPAECERDLLREHLRSQIRGEFAEEDGVLVLARFFTTRTEGRVCALATLLARR